MCLDREIKRIFGHLCEQDSDELIHERTNLSAEGLKRGGTVRCWRTIPPQNESTIDPRFCAIDPDSIDPDSYLRMRYEKEFANLRVDGELVTDTWTPLKNSKTHNFFGQNPVPGRFSGEESDLSALFDRSSSSSAERLAARRSARRRLAWARPS